MTQQATGHPKVCQGSAPTIFMLFSANCFGSAVPVTWAMQVSDAEMGSEMGRWQQQWQIPATSSLSWLSGSPPASPSPALPLLPPVLCEAGAGGVACSCLAHWGSSTFELQGGGEARQLKVYVFY